MPEGGIRQSRRAARARVLVVDDHAQMLEHAALTLQREFTVVAQLRDVESLLQAWPDARPDVVVIDVSLSGCSGFVAAHRLRAAGCSAAIVFLSMHEEPEFVEAAWEAGGIGYVAKRDVGCALVPAVRAALRRDRYVSAAIGPA
jgi:two-component system, NarL family, invasion response regulator UvrY